MNAPAAALRGGALVPNGLAVPRPSTIPRDIAEYARAFDEAERRAREAVHAQAQAQARPQPTPRPGAPVLQIASYGPLVRDVMRRPASGSFTTHGASTGSSIGMMAIVGVIAFGAAMAAAFTFHAPRATAAHSKQAHQPAFIVALAAPSPVADTDAPPSISDADASAAATAPATVLPTKAARHAAFHAVPGVKIAFAVAPLSTTDKTVTARTETKKDAASKRLEAALQALGEEQLKR